MSPWAISFTNFCHFDENPINTTNMHVLLSYVSHAHLGMLGHKWHEDRRNHEEIKTIDKIVITR